MKIISDLNYYKTDVRIQLLIKIWKRYFRNADTDEFNRQFEDNARYKFLKETPRAPPVHRISERNQIIELTYTFMEKLAFDEQFTRQYINIKIWIRLQN
jgi:hypothetical protein